MNQFVTSLSNKKTSKVVAGAFVLALVVSSVALTQATFGPSAGCNENATMSLVGALPATMTPGQQVAFQVKVVNNGDTWFYHGNYFKVAQKSSLSLNPAQNPISPSMRPNDDQVKDYVLTAPTAPGNYTLSLQMVHGAGAEYMQPDSTVCAAAPSNDVYFGQNLTHSFTVDGGQTPPPSPAPEDCVNNAAQYLTGEIINDGNSTGVATARVTNTSSTCSYPIGFASYKMFMVEDPYGNNSDWLTTQEIFDSKTTTIAAGQTINVDVLKINTPDCRNQLDLFEGPIMNPPWYGFDVGHHLMDFAWVDKAVCVHTQNPPPPPPAPTPTINLDKVVRNVSDNQADFVNSTAADFGEQVEFQLRVTATETVNNIVIDDILPSRLQYVNNSLRIEGADGGNNAHSINVGTMTNATKNITLRATVVASSEFSDGSTTLTNTANLTSSAGSDSDAADVVVSKHTSNPPPPPPGPNPPPPPPSSGGSSPKLDIEKTVRNVSDNESRFVEQTEASKDEIVEFKIVIENSRSKTANDVRLRDTLPSQLTYVSGSIDIDGDDVDVDEDDLEDIFTKYVTLGDLDRDDEIVVTYRARVNTSTKTTVTNTARTRASNYGESSDTAKVKIIAGSVQGGNVSLKLSKRAYNSTRNADATTVTAKAGDVITYTLKVQNDGSLDATGYVFEDNIADILQLADVTNFGGASFNASTKTLSWPAVTIQDGQAMEKTFTIRVKSPIPSGTDYVMTNFFGNEVRVPVDHGFVAPNTGAASTMSIVLAFLAVVGFAGYRMYIRRQQLA